MYQKFFSLKAQPFSISPDPDFLFLSDRHKEALAHLMYGLQGNGGFVLLTGEVGTGKTTVCRALLEDISSDTDVAFILNPAQTEVELLATICDLLKIYYDPERASLKTLFDAISGWMVNNLEKGRNAIVLIDEAQHLSFSVLEQLRLLTNIESNNKKPLQVILIGQTELQQKLKENQLRQLAQRITARYHLLPLNRQESEYYIQHRLNIAGASYPIFETRLLKRVFKYSQGIPRLINLICDRSMLCAYSQNSTKVNSKMIDLAVQEMDLNLQTPVKSFKHVWRILLLILLFAVTLFQGPKIYHHFNKPSQALETIGGLITPKNIEAEIPLHELAQGKPSWFNNYPQVDLREKHFSDALKTLYAIWGYDVNVANATCQQGASVSLFCFSERTSLKQLKQLNYPSVIEIVNANEAVYVVLYKVREHYELLIGTQRIKVTEAWLSEYWNGRLTLLWHAPFQLKKPLRFGQKGEQVAWLSKQLNRLQAQPENDKTRFDWKLKEQVMQFQNDNQLSSDGIVGTRTLMALVQQLEATTPNLL